MPYLEPSGLADGEGGEYVLKPFDFRLKGVTSISCDTHKVRDLQVNYPIFANRLTYISTVSPLKYVHDRFSPGSIVRLTLI